MSLFIHCPECDKGYRLGAENAGRTLPCRECGAPMRVPGRSQSRRRARERRHVSRRESEPYPETQSGNGTVWLIGGGIIGALLVVGLTVWFFASGGNKTWTADPDAVASLNDNTGIGELSYRPPRDFQCVKSQYGRNEASMTWESVTDRQTTFVVSVEHKPMYTPDHRPEIFTGLQYRTNARHSIWVPGGQVDEGEINGVHFWRIQSRNETLRRESFIGYGNGIEYKFRIDTPHPADHPLSKRMLASVLSFQRNPTDAAVTQAEIQLPQYHYFTGLPVAEYAVNMPDRGRNQKAPANDPRQNVAAATEKQGTLRTGEPADPFERNRAAAVPREEQQPAAALLPASDELVLDTYGLKPPTGFEPKESKWGRGRAEVVWTGPKGQSETTLEFDVSYHAKYTAQTEPMIVTTPVRSLTTTQDVILLPGGTVNVTSLAGTRFWRITREQDGEADLIYVGYGNGVKFVIRGETKGTMDSPLYAQLEAAARSFRIDATTATLTRAEIDAATSQRQPGLPLTARTSRGFGMGNAPPPANRPAVEAAEPTGPFSHDGDVAFEVPVPTDARCVFSTPTKQAFAVNGIVYSATTGKPIGQVTLPGEFDQHASHALSPNGQFYAVGERDQKTLGVVQLLDAKGGQPKQITLTPTGSSKSARLEYLAFLGDDKLLMAWRFAPDDLVAVYHLETNRIMLQFPTEGVGSVAAVSPEGKYLALPNTRGLTIYEISKKRAVAEMKPPTGDSTAFFFNTLQGLAFSPDSQEIAGLSFRNRLLVWSGKGDVVFDQPLPQELGFGNSYQLGVQWLPDKSGWMIKGHDLIDRTTRQHVWHAEEVSGSRFPHVLIDQDHMLAAAGSRRIGFNYITYRLPWASIHAALGKAGGAQQILKPGDSISLQLTVGNVRFADQAQVRAQITEAIATRLKQDKLSLADGQPVVLTVSYSESEGRDRKVVDQFQRSTGMTIKETIGSLEMKLTVPGRAKPLWESQQKLDGGLILSGEATTENARNEMFGDVLRRIGSIVIPQFITNNEAVELPVKSEF